MSLFAARAGAATSATQGITIRIGTWRMARLPEPHHMTWPAGTLSARHDEMGATVAGERRFAVERIERPFLAVGDRLQPVCGHAERDEVVARGARALVAKGEVVLRGAALVAVAFHRDLGGAMVLQPERVLLEHGAGLVAER